VDICNGEEDEEEDNDDDEEEEEEEEEEEDGFCIGGMTIASRTSLLLARSRLPCSMAT